MSKEKLLESFRNIAGITTLREGRMAEVDQIMQDIASGELDCYDVMNNPKTPVEQYAAQQLQQMYDQVSIDHHLHPDDQFEEIIDIMCDQLAQEYGDDRSMAPIQREGAVLIGMSMDDIRKVAGLQESFEDRLEAAREKARAKGKLKDEDEKEDKKPAVRKVSGSAYGGSKQKADADEGSGESAAKTKPTEKAEKPEETKKADSADSADKAEAPKKAEKAETPKAEKKAAGGASFSAIAKQVLKSGGGAAAVKAACQKAGVTVPNHLHSRLNALKKNLKESFYVITHPQMPSFVLAENPMMNQYQWISNNDLGTSLTPLIFETVDGAKQVVEYIERYKSQLGEITKVELEA